MHMALNASDVGRLRGGNESYLWGLLDGLSQVAEAAGIRVSLVTSAQGAGRVRGEPRFDAFRVYDTGVYRRLPFLLWQQTRLVRRIRPDWYLSTFFRPPALPCRAAVLVHDLSFRAHPEYFPRTIGLYMRLLTGLALRRAESVIALSEFTRQEIARFYPAAAARTAVLYPGVGREFTAQADAAADERLLAGLGVEPPYLLAVGNIHPRKNLGRLLAAWQRLRDGGRQVPAMVWVGQRRWESGPLLDRARAAGVCLPGFVDVQQLPAIYRRAEALAYPSLYEGFGLPPLEAMACGTPVLAAGTTSLPEAVGDAAVVVDPASVEALAEGLERVLFDGGLRRDLRARGLARAARFRWSRTAEGLIQILRGSPDYSGSGG
ncbi:MAG: glycosyltransferase family 1 protein [Anaerolineae bacterium]